MFEMTKYAKILISNSFSYCFYKSSHDKRMNDKKAKRATHFYFWVTLFSIIQY